MRKGSIWSCVLVSALGMQMWGCTKCPPPPAPPPPCPPTRSGPNPAIAAMQMQGVASVRAPSNVRLYGIPLTPNDMAFPPDAWPRPINVTTDAQNVWVTDSSGRLWRFSKETGTPTLIADRDHPVGHFIVEGEQVYLCTKNGIMTTSASGERPTMLIEDSNQPVTAVSDDNYWYYSTFSTPAIRRAIRGGGKPENFVNAAKGSSIAIDKTHLYVADSQNGKLSKIPLQGPKRPTVLVRGENSLAEVIVDDEFVYYLSDGDLAIRRVKKSGGEPQTLIERRSIIIGRIAMDSSHVYWVHHSPVRGHSTVLRMPKNGGDVEVVAEHLLFPGGLHVDAEHVYMATGAQTVMRIPKPKATVPF